VEEHYKEDITLECISKYAGFSSYHFTRFFKESTGISFGQYLRNFRITKAEWHLINSGETIAQAAYKSGFNSIKTFNRVFKDVTGRSPTDFRKDANTAINEDIPSIPD
jgi:AraC-like DNA-binding protein